MNPQSGMLGFNMFAYCQNNPIKYSDGTGHSITLACIIIGAVIGAIAGGATGAYVSKKKTGKVNGWAVAGGAIGGAALGGLAGWGVGTAIAAGGAAAGTASGTVAGTVAKAGQEVYNNWQSAEQGLRNTISSVTDYGSRAISTPNFERVVDAYNKASGTIGGSYPLINALLEAGIDVFIIRAIDEMRWSYVLAYKKNSL